MNFQAEEEGCACHSSSNGNKSALEEVAICLFHEAVGFSLELCLISEVYIVTSKNSLHTF